MRVSRSACVYRGEGGGQQPDCRPVSQPATGRERSKIKTRLAVEGLGSGWQFSAPDSSPSGSRGSWACGKLRWRPVNKLDFAPAGGGCVLEETTRRKSRQRQDCGRGRWLHHMWSPCVVGARGGLGLAERGTFTRSTQHAAREETPQTTGTAVFQRHTRGRAGENVSASSVRYGHRRRAKREGHEFAREGGGIDFGWAAGRGWSGRVAEALLGQFLRAKVVMDLDGDHANMVWCFFDETRAESRNLVRASTSDDCCGGSSVEPVLLATAAGWGGAFPRSGWSGRGG